MKKISTVAAHKIEKVEGQKLTIGLDLGDRSSWYCVLDERGELLLEQKLATTPKAMREVFGGMARSRMALETGTHSPWVSRLLSELGHWCGAPRSASACEPSCDRLSSNSASACTIPCPKPDNGSSRSCKATSTTTRYRETSRVWVCSGIGCSRSGGVLFAAGARNAGSPGRALSFWLSDGFLNRERSIPFLTLASPPVIRDKNRMR
jgi:hypothetical protein